MKHIFTKILIASCLLTSGFVFATEPTNLNTAKEAVIKYHDTGEYDQDIANVMANAMQYLKQRIDENKDNSKKLAIVLDIDETSLSNYPDMLRLDFGGTIEEIRADEDKGEDDAITPTLILYKYAKIHNVSVFFITGRREDERATTEANLKKVGYRNYDGLVLRHGKFIKGPAAIYKSAMRKKLTENGYDIIISVGDQQSDLDGGYADKTFKLPNPYYFIP